jgi:hypothetical protein
MTLSRRSVLRRTAGVAASFLFADVLGLDRISAVLASTQYPPVYRSQLDGSYCCCANCTPTSGAMLRSSMTNEGCNPSGASVRIWYNRKVPEWGGASCPTGTNNCSCHTGGTCTGNCPDYGVDTNHAQYMVTALNTANDGCTTQHSVELEPGISWSYFASLLVPTKGWSAMVNGVMSSSTGHDCDPGCPSPCWHTVFVLKSDGSGNYQVYDPDNANGCSQYQWWTTSQLQDFAYPYAGTGYVYCYVGLGNS